MKTKKPLIGLLIYSFYSMGGSLAIVLSLSLLIGIVALISGNNLLMQAFTLTVFGAAPYVVLTKSGGTAKWERFQLAMPIKRKNLATSLYLNVLIALILELPVAAIVVGAGFIFNEGMADLLRYGGFANFAFFVYGIALLFAALLYPLACTKLGGRNEQGLFFVCMVGAGAIVGAIAVVGSTLGLSDGTTSFLIVAVAGGAFIASYFITRMIYAKIDF